MHSKLRNVCISFYDDVYYYIFSLAQDKELAKDLTQETFLKALKSLHHLKDDAKIKSWLFSIARNSCLTELRKRNRVILDELVADLIDVQMLTPEQAYLLHENEQWWDTALASLNEEDKKIFELRVTDKYPYEEIAQQLKISAGAARIKFHRLRLKIIKLLEKRVSGDE